MPCRGVDVAILQTSVKQVLAELNVRIKSLEQQLEDVKARESQARANNKVRFHFLSRRVIVLTIGPRRCEKSFAKFSRQLHS